MDIAALAVASLEIQERVHVFERRKIFGLAYQWATRPARLFKEISHALAAHPSRAAITSMSAEASDLDMWTF